MVRTCHSLLHGATRAAPQCSQPCYMFDFRSDTQRFPKCCPPPASVPEQLLLFRRACAQIELRPRKPGRYSASHRNCEGCDHDTASGLMVAPCIEAYCYVQLPLRGTTKHTCVPCAPLAREGLPRVRKGNTGQATC